MRDDLRRRLTDSLETATAPGRRPGAHRGGPAATARPVVHLLRALRLPGARRVAARAGAADLLVQLAPRRVPHLHRARLHPRGRSRDGGRPGAHPPRGSARCRGPTAPPTTTTCCSGVIATTHSIDLDTVWRALPQRHRDLHARRPQRRRERMFLGRRRKGGGSWGWFEGVLPQLRRQHATSMSHAMREVGGAVHVAAALPGLRRRAAAPESLAVTVSGRNIHEVCLLSVSDALAFFAIAGADRHPGAHRRARHPGDQRAAAVPRRRRASATSPSTAPPGPCRAARPSASGWPPRSARASWACSTSSTSPPSACTSATTAS